MSDALNDQVLFDDIDHSFELREHQHLVVVALVLVYKLVKEYHLARSIKHLSIQLLFGAAAFR